MTVAAPAAPVDTRTKRQVARDTRRNEAIAHKKLTSKGATIAAALARAFVANRGEGVGNFWADLTRTTLYVLLPAALILAVALMLAQPSMIKRPVLDLGDGRTLVGFKPERYAEAFAV